jgi:hypothetical protein
MPFALLYPLLSVVPAGVLMLILKARHWWAESLRLRVPVSEKLLRTPGETVRRKKEELDDQIVDSMVWIFGFPPVLLISYLVSTRTTPSPPSTIWVFALLLGVSVYVKYVIKLAGLVEKRADLRLGASGERAVGEELNRLMAEGCQVFHDFPLDQRGNVDHIVVAPSGVYAVETKIRRKGEPAGRQKAHEVIYDGKGLQFPGWYDKEHLIQARNEARSLSDFLGRGVGFAVPVKPVLTFPGWSVTSRASGDVLVLDPRMIRPAVIEDASPTLTPDEIKRIALRLEEKCRDVEF